MLQQDTSAWKATILMEQRQGHAIQMERGQTKNQPARVSFVNGERGTNIKVILQKRAEEIKMKRKE